jgi:hypothetical protein
MGTHEFISKFKEAPIRLERLKECFHPVRYEDVINLPTFFLQHCLNFPKNRGGIQSIKSKVLAALLY